MLALKIENGAVPKNISNKMYVTKAVSGIIVLRVQEGIKALFCFPRLNGLSTTQFVNVYNYSYCHAYPINSKWIFGTHVTA